MDNRFEKAYYFGFMIAWGKQKQARADSVMEFDLY